MKLLYICFDINRLIRFYLTNTQPVKLKYMVTQAHEMINPQLGIKLHYWNGVNKNERVFLASEIMNQLGFKGALSTLKIHELIENVDFVKVLKIKHKDLFLKLSGLNLVGQRTAHVVFLYESGVWKLIMRSRKQIGIKTRNWIASEVLPSIRVKGYYNISESQLNPLSYLNDFTERKTQIQNSKSVNSFISKTTGDFSSYHNQVHKMVNGMTAKDIQVFFNSKESARETLRKYLPENACTEAVIDELFIKYGKTLEEIDKSGANNTLPPAFKSLFELGIKAIY